MNPFAVSLQRFLLILSILAFVIWSAGCAQLRGNQRPKDNVAFQSRLLPIETFHLFDIGVTDWNQDDILDLYTANHSARQSFLLGNGRGGWKVWPLEATGLSQSPAFPGLEDADRSPKFTLPGLYIYWSDSQLVLHSYRLQSNPVQGQLVFFTPITIEDHGDFGTWSSTNSDTEAQHTRLHFQADGNGELILTPQPYPRVGSPIRLELADATMIERTFIGLNRIRPPQPRVLLDLKDRHGVVWIPIQDGKTRVFIAGGGNLGLTDILPPERRTYEYFQLEDNTFQPLDAVQLGLNKGDCAARQTSFLDVNKDGWGDFYIVCIRNTANQLFLGSAEGRFVESAANVGLDIPRAGTFAWLDVDEDGWPDLIWVGERGVRLYHNQGGAFQAVAIQAPKVWAQHISLADFDGDGDGDAFVVSKDANLLLINEHGTLQYRDPTTLGLPQASLTAQWVDVNNDGRVDLYTVPEGVFLQTQDARFQSSDILAKPTILPLDELRSARAVWFDADNDGYRELVVAIQTLDKQWQVTYLKRHPGHNHWLEVILSDPHENALSMDAKITVQTPAGTQVSRVGWDENSHYGQGNPRVYFGLGDQATIISLTVTWSDGITQTLSQVPADQILKISRPSP